MYKNILIFLVMILVALSGCQYFVPQDDNELITGEVIEIFPGQDDVILDLGTDQEMISSENDSMMNESEDVEMDQSSSMEYNPDDFNLVIERTEGEEVFIQPDAYDPDGDSLIFTFSEPFDIDGTWMTEEGDAGEYVVTVTASDGRLSTSEDVLVIIKPTNKAPVIECDDEMTFQEGDTIKIDCNIYDPEGEDVDVQYTGWMNSDEKELGYDDSGFYYVNVKASDGVRETIKLIKIFVDNKNRAPIVEDIEDINVYETETITLDVEAYDLDEDDLEYSYSEPFDENGVWETKLGDVGTYEAYVTVTDGFGSVRKLFTVTVNQMNTVPTLDFISPITVDEGETIVLPINAVDREGDNITVSISGWFTTRTYTTNYDDAGEHVVTVEVSDGELSISQDVEITVNDVNRPPVFNFG